MKIITDDTRLLRGVEEAVKELHIAPHGTFVARKTSAGLHVIKSGETGTIEYGDTRALMRGISLIAEMGDRAAYEIFEEPHYDTLGVMPDVSRNAVLNMESFRKLCRICALAGYNAIMLYTEDTYEVEGYPYFGHLRGRYTAAELREMDDYADLLGLELIPCIQTLAHLNAFMEWPDSKRLRDCNDILMVGDERVYELIDKMLSTMSTSLRSRRINLGLDEAFMLGRGEYLHRNGYRPSYEIMKEHLERVLSICKKYGYQPRMWSDMYFRISNDGVYRVMGRDVPPQIVASVPEEVTLIYWEYVQTRQERYGEMFRQHRAFCNPIAFAGGDVSWYGLIPLNRLGLQSSIAANHSLQENGTREVYVTMWGDDGAACSLFSTLSTLLIYSESCWGDAATAEDRMRRRLRVLSGLEAEDLLALEDIHRLPTKESGTDMASNPTKYMLYQSVLTGKFDAHVPSGSDAHFAAQAHSMWERAKRAGEYGYIFESIACLCDVLAMKAEMGHRLRRRYLAQDREGVAQIASDLPKLQQRIKRLHTALREQWMRENKSFGFDVLDIRIYGLIGQLESARVILEQWITGERECVEELEADRLPYMDCPEDCSLTVNRWQMIAGINLSNMFGL